MVHGWDSGQQARRMTEAGVLSKEAAWASLLPFKVSALPVGVQEQPPSLQQS